IRPAVSSWTTARTAATVVSHAFTYSGPENPTTLRAYPAGSCSRPYTPSATATAAPTRTKVSRGRRYRSRVAPASSVVAVMTTPAPRARGWQLRGTGPPSLAHHGVGPVDGGGLLGGPVEREGGVLQVQRRGRAPVPADVLEDRKSVV